MTLDSLPNHSKYCPMLCMLCGLLVISVPLTQNLWLLDWALEIIENGRDVLCVWRNMFQYLQTLSGHLQTCEYGHVNNMQSTNAFSVECNSQCAGDMQVVCTNGSYFHCSWKHNTKKSIIFLSEVRIKQFGHICYFFSPFLHDDLPICFNFDDF